MNSDQNQEALFEHDLILEKLEDYVSLCISVPEGSENDEKKKTKKPKGHKYSFPNLAGFCRYLKISTEEFEKLSADHPIIYERILTVLEDEALNSELSPTLVSAYLKKRIGYESVPTQKSAVQGLQISFEHDIFEDGE